MRRTAFVFAGLALVATAAFSGEGQVRRNERRIPGRYVIVLEPGVDTAAVANSVRNLNGARVRHTYERGVKGLAVEVNDSDAQALARDARVQFVEEDSIINAAATWGLDRIDQRQLPLNGEYVNAVKGEGVTLYIVDTGVAADHSEFGGRVAAGYSAYEGGTADCNGHGTHVAGIAAGATYGVAKLATVVPVRVLDCNGAGSISSLLAGLDWILERHALTPSPSVVNMSLGGEPSSALDAQVAKLIAAGMPTVVAAGNRGVDACATSPARVSSVLTVGATNETDQRASFSNFGACVDVFAPGVNIQSAWYASPTASAVANGTSSSTPFVAGVAALWLDEYPTASPNAVNQAVLSQATIDAVTMVGDGSPNRLLFSSVGPLPDNSDNGDSNLLGDPGFEYGEIFWTSDVCTVINPAGCGGQDIEGIFDVLSLPSRSGNGKAAIGGPARSFHLTSEAITIPTNVTRARLSFYLYITTKNRRQTAEDIMTVEIRDRNGALLETLGSFSNLDATTGYVLRQFDMTRFRGVTIRISFTGVQTQGPPTWFLLDDAALNIWR